MDLHDPHPARRLALPAALLAAVGFASTACGGSILVSILRIPRFHDLCLDPEPGKPGIFQVRSSRSPGGACDRPGVPLAAGARLDVEADGQTSWFDIPVAGALRRVRVDRATGDTVLELDEGLQWRHLRPAMVDRRYAPRPAGRRHVWLYLHDVPSASADATW